MRAINWRSMTAIAVRACGLGKPVHEEQFRSSELPSPLVFLPISTHSSRFTRSSPELAWHAQLHTKVRPSPGCDACDVSFRAVRMYGSAPYRASLLCRSCLQRTQFEGTQAARLPTYPR